MAHGKDEEAGFWCQWRMMGPIHSPARNEGRQASSAAFSSDNLISGPSLESAAHYEGAGWAGALWNILPSANPSWKFHHQSQRQDSWLEILSSWQSGKSITLRPMNLKPLPAVSSNMILQTWCPSQMRMQLTNKRLVSQQNGVAMRRDCEIHRAFQVANYPGVFNFNKRKSNIITCTDSTIGAGRGQDPPTGRCCHTECKTYTSKHASHQNCHFTHSSFRT